MKNKNREGENYIKREHLLDDGLESPQAKRKKQQDDASQNSQQINVPQNPETNTTLGEGNTREDGSKAPKPKR